MKRIVALGLTWNCHARETGERISASGPAVFSRAPSSLIEDGRIVLPSRARIVRALDELEPGLGRELVRRWPDFPVLLDYEIELGVRIEDDGGFAWFLANDVTVRTVQILGEGTSRRMDYWSAAKSLPSTLLVGATTLRTDETPEVELVLRVNGEVRQRARSTSMIYGARDLLRFAGLLTAGDVVLTGTPGGVALSVPLYKRMVADLLFDRWRKLRAASRIRGFLRAGDVVSMDGGPLGSVRAIVEEEAA